MILHVDMDAFYASVEERDRPELAGRPVIVGGTPEGRGVVAAANYQARRFGVHSAMPAATAKRLCPQAICLPSRIDHYAKVSAEIQAILRRYTPLIEPLSLDEAFLDVTGSESLFGSSEEIGWRIKREIHKQLNLVASVGVAPNKFLAKIASDLEKPDGFVVVDSKRIHEFLDPLPVGRVWGVGRVTGSVLDRHGVRSIGDLRQLSVDALRALLGGQGQHLWHLARGIDGRPVVPDSQAKSISHETTFAIDVDNEEVLRAWVIELTEQVARRLRRQNLRGRTVHLKVRFDDFRTMTRATTLADPTDVTQQLCDVAGGMLARRLPQNGRPVRLLGVGVSGIDHSADRQRMLFEENAHGVQQRLDSATDQIRVRFGHSSLRRASSMLHQAERSPDTRPTEGDDARPDD